MTLDRDKKLRETAARGKYRGLYMRLRGLATQEWRISFGEIESIMGFALPRSARIHRPWWVKQESGNGHSHALAWSAAGWETADVDMDAETLLLRRKPVKAVRMLDLDEILPVHSAGAWPEGLGISREDIYEERL